jgi:glycosyltransferase involved in cell wall biosynthesis
MRILTFTTLYPNAAASTHGIFVENRLRCFAHAAEAEVRVLAPVPWFPFKSERFGRYAVYARAPRAEERFGFMVEHPRFFVPPKVGMTVAPLLLFAVARRAARQLAQSGWDFDLIDAHYFYPDGVAAVMLGRALSRPVTITARGSDLGAIARRYAPQRAMVRWAARNADAVITVSQGLREELLALGGRPRRLKVIRNGVDLDLFFPLPDRAAARAALALRGPTLLSVGALIPRKRHDLPIRALRDLPGFELLVIGDGPEQSRLKNEACIAGVEERVRFFGRIPHEALPAFYGAADALVLASEFEGWANVLLESMACGTPVVGSDIPGNREVVAESGGLLMRSHDPGGIADAVRRLFARGAAGRRAARAYAERFSWDEVSRRQIELFSEILRETR